MLGLWIWWKGSEYSEQRSIMPLLLLLCDHSSCQQFSEVGRYYLDPILKISLFYTCSLPSIHTHTHTHTAHYPQQWATGNISLTGFKPSNSFPSQPKDTANSSLWSLKYYIIWPLPDFLFYYSLESPWSGHIDCHSVPVHSNLILPLGFLYFFLCLEMFLTVLS